MPFVVRNTSVKFRAYFDPLCGVFSHSSSGQRTVETGARFHKHDIVNRVYSLCSSADIREKLFEAREALAAHMRQNPESFKAPRFFMIEIEFDATAPDQTQNFLGLRYNMYQAGYAQIEASNIPETSSLSDVAVDERGKMSVCGLFSDKTIAKVKNLARATSVKVKHYDIERALRADIPIQSAEYAAAVQDFYKKKGAGPSFTNKTKWAVARLVA